MKDSSIHSRRSSISAGDHEIKHQVTNDQSNSSVTVNITEKEKSIDEKKSDSVDVATMKDGVDIESGVSVKEEITEDQILSKEVQTLPIRQLIPAFLGVAMTLFMAALDNSIVSTALPKIGTEFQASNKVELVFTCYVITANAFQAIFLAGSILSGASTSMNMFLGGRALTGMGAGGLFSLSNIIIADIVSIRDRGKYQGFISAVFAISALVGPVMGGAFVDKVSWKWCFYIQVAFGAIAVPTIAIMLKLPRPKGNVWEKLAAIDWAGTFFMALTTVFLLLPTNLGGNMYEWKSPLVISFYCLSVPSAIAFLLIEAKYAKQPIVPPYLWKNRNVVTLFSVNLFMGMTFWTLIFYLPIYFQVIEHETATAAGLTMIPLEAGIFISSNIAGILVSKYGRYRPYIFAGTSMAAVGIGLCLVLANTDSKVAQVFILFACGLGIGPLFPCLIVAIQASVERKDIATVSALHNFFRMTGSGFGVAINGALYQNHIRSSLNSGYFPQDVADLAISSAQKIIDIPIEYRGLVEEIYLNSMKIVFKATIPMAVIMFLLTFNLKHIRLNSKVPAASSEDTTAAKVDKEVIADNNEKE
ncbi:hypothetical protein BGZ76_008987 [Entomortierella beljakovae]|nr:hypothetical protein BGZ76_008987 [Entomortierella beljakovae]